MKRQGIRRGLLALAVATLVGTVVAPAAAQAGTATKPGKDIPCEVVEKPKPKGPPAEKPKGKDEGKGKGRDTNVAVLICGDIAKISGRHRVTALTIKTGKGPVVVRVTRTTVVYKGDGKVPVKALKVGAPVIIKAEQLANGTFRAGAIVLL